jgi:hypothetical protein
VFWLISSCGYGPWFCGDIMYIFVCIIAMKPSFLLNIVCLCQFLHAILCLSCADSRYIFIYIICILCIYKYWCNVFWLISSCGYGPCFLLILDIYILGIITWDQVFSSLLGIRSWVQVFSLSLGSKFWVQFLESKPCFLVLGPSLASCMGSSCGSMSWDHVLEYRSFVIVFCSSLRCNLGNNQTQLPSQHCLSMPISWR